MKYSVMLVLGCLFFNTFLIPFVGTPATNQIDAANPLMQTSLSQVPSEDELTHMNLTVELDESRSVLNGSIIIDYYNNDPIAFSRIPFHIYPSGMLYDNRQGRIDIFNVTTTEPLATDLSFEVLHDDQIMWIDLDEAVQPGEFTEFQIIFNTTLPDGLDRGNENGLDSAQSRIFTMSSCYPIPCVYDEWDGWNTDPYVDFGDPYYFDMAICDLIITIPDDMVIAATGTLLDSQSDGENATYHFNPILPVRELTFSASRYFQTESMMVGDVNVSTFYIPSSEPQWDSALNHAKQALELFNETYGIYPYQTLNVVEQWGFYGGMEYPCQVYITKGLVELIRTGQREPWALEIVIAHEVAHEWWSQLVGDDCIDWGFLDEMMASWSHSYYAEIYYGDWEYFQWTKYIDDVRVHNYYFSRGSTVNQSHSTRHPDDVGYIDYTKGPLMMEKLRLALGHDTFVDSLRHFFEEFKYKIAILPDLQDAFEEVTGENLDWIFLPLFDNPYLPNYEFESVTFDPATGILLISVEDVNEDSNPYSFPQQIPLRVYDINDQTLVEEDVWINGTTLLNYTMDTQPDRVRLVYEGYILAQLLSSDHAFLETDTIQILAPPLDPLTISIGVLSVVIVGSIVVVFLLKRRQK